MNGKNGKIALANPMAYLRRLWPAKGSFSANVLTLMTGTTLAQGLTIAAAPILTRLYTPEDFGVYAIFLSIAGILSIFAGLRYELAIMLPHKDEDAANLLALSSLISVGMSLLVLLIVALGRQQIAGYLRAPELAPWLWWAPASLLLSGLYQSLNYWSNRKKHYARLAVSRGGQAGAAVLYQVAAGALTQAGAGGLVAGNISGQAIGTGILGRAVLREDYHLLSAAVRPTRLWRQGSTYYRFPLFETWAGLANLGAHQLPPLFLNFFFGAATAGFYSLGYRLLNIPLLLVNASFAQVFFQRYEEKRKSGGKREFLLYTLKLLTALAAFPALLLFLFSPWLFGVVFGPEWRVAGDYIRILAPLLLCRFIASPTSSVLRSENKNFWFLIWQSSFLILTILAFVVGGLFYSDKIGILFYSLFGSLLYIILIFINIKSSY